MQAIQAVDRETATAVVIPGATTCVAARILRMIVDGEVNNAAAERERIVAHIRCCSCAPCRRLADSIERGEHLEEK